MPNSTGPRDRRDDPEPYNSSLLGEQLEALGDHVILEEVEAAENRTPSGLLIPASALQPKNGYRRYRVLAVGPYCSDDRISEFPEPSIQPGDIVVAPSDELGSYREGGQTLYIAQYEAIAAVIREG